MALSDFFSNDFETSNNNKNPKLVTHHYRADYFKVRSEVLNVCERLGLEFVVHTLAVYRIKISQTSFFVGSIFTEYLCITHYRGKRRFYIMGNRCNDTSLILLLYFEVFRKRLKTAVNLACISLEDNFFKLSRFIVFSNSHI